MAPRSRFVENPEADQELRREGGLWMKFLRERAGHTQRSFAIATGVDYYTFISQIETGRGRIPLERMRDWAAVLGVPADEFLREYMRYWEPIMYDILFGDKYPRPEIGPTRPHTPKRLVADNS